MARVVWTHMMSDGEGYRVVAIPVSDRQEYPYLVTEVGRHDSLGELSWRSAQTLEKQEEILRMALLDFVLNRKELP